jgi:hypothetical protein
MAGWNPAGQHGAACRGNSSVAGCLDLSAVDRHHRIKRALCFVAAGRLRLGLIKPMKVMDRPMAVADTEAIGRRDRGADPVLGLANRGFHILAPRKTRRDR